MVLHWRLRELTQVRIRYGIQRYYAENAGQAATNAYIAFIA
jgi:hypothetical protein